MSFVLTFWWDLWQKQQHCGLVTLKPFSPSLEAYMAYCPFPRTMCWNAGNAALALFLVLRGHLFCKYHQSLLQKTKCCHLSVAGILPDFPQSLWCQYWNWSKSKFPNIYKQKFLDWWSLSCRCNNILPPYKETCPLQGTAQRFSQICCVRDYSGTNRSKIGLQLCPRKESRRRTNGMNKKMKNKWRPDRER